MKKGIITIAAILMMAISFVAHAEELSLEPIFPDSTTRPARR